ncbi:MAG: hypothetical protein ACM3PP_08795 [Candidatus Saccharibacteria bacterium]
MDKTRMSPRVRTIERLQSFLQNSVDLEPELEQFIKHLIMALQSAYTYDDAAYAQSISDDAANSPSKIHH